MKNISKIVLLTLALFGVGMAQASWNNCCNNSCGWRNCSTCNDRCTCRRSCDKGCCPFGGERRMVVKQTRSIVHPDARPMVHPDAMGPEMKKHESPVKPEPMIMEEDAEMMEVEE